MHPESDSPANFLVNEISRLPDIPREHRLGQCHIYIALRGFLTSFFIGTKVASFLLQQHRVLQGYASSAFFSFFLNNFQMLLFFFFGPSWGNDVFSNATLNAESGISQAVCMVV
jgi:hypothetical protein